MKEEENLSCLQWKDLRNSLILSCGMILLRRGLNDTVFKFIGLRLGAKAKGRRSLQESGWKIMCYTCAFILACIAVMKYNLWSSLPQALVAFDPRYHEVVELKHVYTFQTSLYIHSLYDLFTLDMWRSDSLMLACHHGIAVAACLIAFNTRYMFGGVMITFLFDINDILLESCKIVSTIRDSPGFNYKLWNKIGEALFLVFTITWGITRIYFYLIKVIIPFTTAHTLLGNRLQPITHYFILSCTILFLAFNVFWSKIILSLLIRGIKGERITDVREKE